MFLYLIFFSILFLLIISLSIFSNLLFSIIAWFRGLVNSLRYKHNREQREPSSSSYTKEIRRRDRVRKKVYDEGEGEYVDYEEV